MHTKVARALFVALALSLIFWGLLLLLERPALQHPLLVEDDVLVIAHRGGAGLRPENTLLAFEHALSLGADILEFDVRATKDGALVVIHDSAVDRTTGGAGPVNSLTLEEIKELDAGYTWSGDGGWTFPWRGHGLSVPTVAEVFTAFPDARMDIEIKDFGTNIAATLCNIVRDYGRAEKTLVASLDTRTIKEFRRACPEVATSPSRSETLAFYILGLLRLEAMYLPPFETLQVPQKVGPLSFISRGFIRAAHKCSLRIYVWTVNDSSQMQNLLGKNVDGIITDYPDRLRSVLERQDGKAR